MCFQKKLLIVIILSSCNILYSQFFTYNYGTFSLEDTLLSRFHKKKELRIHDSIINLIRKEVILLDTFSPIAFNFEYCRVLDDSTIFKKNNYFFTILDFTFFKKYRLSYCIRIPLVIDIKDSTFYYNINPMNFKIKFIPDKLVKRFQLGAIFYKKSPPFINRKI
jgi:hypothetical protein